MKKHIYAAILAVASAFAASAQDNEDHYLLLVNTNDGNTVEFAFEYCPVATFEGDEMVITDELHAESIRYNMSDIANLKVVGEGTAVDDIAGQLLKVTVTKQIVSVSGLEEGAAVNIYDMSGRLVASATAGSDGSVVIAADGLGTGVFVASMPGNTFKFIR